MKKFLSFLIGIFFIAGGTASARDIYVGTSPATGWDCYLQTETIYWINDLTDFEATLKMLDYENDIGYFLDYRFWHEAADINNGIYDRVYFSNSDGFHGIVDEIETPIEYWMWLEGSSLYAEGIE